MGQEAPQSSPPETAGGGECPPHSPGSETKPGAAAGALGTATLVTYPGPSLLEGHLFSARSSEKPGSFEASGGVHLPEGLGCPEEEDAGPGSVLGGWRVLGRVGPGSQRPALSLPESDCLPAPTAPTTPSHTEPTSRTPPRFRSAPTPTSAALPAASIFNSFCPLICFSQLPSPTPRSWRPPGFLACFLLKSPAPPSPSPLPNRTQQL